MLIDVVIGLEHVNHPHVMSVQVRDRQNILQPLLTVTDPRFEIPIKVVFPSRISIGLTSLHDKASTRLHFLRVGGLLMPDKKLDEISLFTTSQGKELFTRDWFTQGSVSIDFFAANWIDYHLLHGNRIGI